MAVHKITLGRTVDGIVEYIYPRSIAELIEYTDTQNVRDKLDELDETTSDLYDITVNLQDALDKAQESADAAQSAADAAMDAAEKAQDTADSISYKAGTGLDLDTDTNTFNHLNSITADTIRGSGTGTLAYGSSFKIPSITYDSTGHITATAQTTLTLPGVSDSINSTSSNTAASSAAVNNVYNIAIAAQEAAESAQNAADANVYTAGTGISISSSNVINHSNSVTAGTASGSATGTLSYGGTFTIPSITYDAQGHITGSSTTTMTMPAEVTSVSTAEKLGTSTVGSGTKPIYLSSGIATASSSTVGSSSTPVYLNAGTITACSSITASSADTATTAEKLGSSTVGSGTKPIYLSSGTATASSSTVGSSSTPVYLNAGTITACTDIETSSNTCYYGTCSTDATVAIKTATIDGFSLTTGVTVIIKFTYGNTTTSPTLNISNTGNIGIYTYGTTRSGLRAFPDDSIVQFVYDGARWLIVSMIDGYNCIAGGSASHAEGYRTTVSANYSHAEGYETTVSAVYSHAEGYETTASALSSHAEGENTIASGMCSHAEGTDTTASGNYSHVEGIRSTASGTYGSHAEGYSTTASGNYGSHAEGFHTTASGNHSHAEGEETTVSGEYGSHAEGHETTVSGNYGSHAEGELTIASGNYSHAEGCRATASAAGSHAEGYRTTVSGNYSHAEGYGTTANNLGMHAGGKFNKPSSSTMPNITYTIGDVFVLGNGSDDDSLSNAFRVTYAGDVYGLSSFNSSGADYAEFIKPWADGNPNEEDRVGYFVTIKDGMLYKASSGDYIAGITSGNPSIVGNSDEDYYHKYERDEFNRIIWEDVIITKNDTDESTEELEINTTSTSTIQKDDENGIEEPNTQIELSAGKPMSCYIDYEDTDSITCSVMKISEDYDNTLQDTYVERKDRPEWDYVGMIGVLPVRDDGTCEAGGFAKCGEDGIATSADSWTIGTYYVIERITDNVISVIFK